MKEHHTDEYWFGIAERAAQNALCKRAKCGAVIVSQGGELIGEGYNAPPRNDVLTAKCNDEFDRTIKPKYDLTCCVHAEWRAIADALANNSEMIVGSTLYYVRLGEGGVRKPSRKPFCTVCSRLALDMRIGKFGLWHEDGITLYDTRDYNELSYAFHKK